MYLLLLVILISLLAVIFTAIQFFNILFRKGSPFLSTKHQVIEKILAEVQLNAGDQVYELGCGKANLSFALEKKFPGILITAIEYSFLPFAIAKLKTIFKNSKVKILKQNIFKVDLGAANLVYCYLNPLAMKSLAEKIKTECQPGTKIISYRFTLPGATAEKIVEVKTGKIYFYKV